MPTSGIPDKIRNLIEHELQLIERLDYARYFLTVHDIVAVCAAARHPVPGARLGGQFGRLLLPRHHRGRPGAHRRAVRALHQRRAQRAARHRRRFRARAARGGDPVHLRKIRPRPRRSRRHRDLLPLALGDPRGRQGAGTQSVDVVAASPASSGAGATTRSPISGCARPGSTPPTALCAWRSTSPPS